MSLDKAALAAALKTAFESGMDDPNWTLDDAAGALADAIDFYVRGAEVAGVTTEVRDPGNVVIGTGAQTGTGTLA